MLGFAPKIVMRHPGTATDLQVLLVCVSQRCFSCETGAWHRVALTTNSDCTRQHSRLFINGVAAYVLPMLSAVS
jgi:hypothetical protein